MWRHTEILRLERCFYIPPHPRLFSFFFFFLTLEKWCVLFRYGGWINVMSIVFYCYYLEPSKYFVLPLSWSDCCSVSLVCPFLFRCSLFFLCPYCKSFWNLAPVCVLFCFNRLHIVAKPWPGFLPFFHYFISKHLSVSLLYCRHICSVLFYHPKYCHIEVKWL